MKFRKEALDRPKGNARRALEEIEKLRVEDEAAPDRWIRCTVGMMKSSGGTGMAPCVLALTDRALYVGKGGRWVDVLRVPFAYLADVGAVPYLTHSFALAIVGREQVGGSDDVEFVVSSTDRGRSSFRDRSAYFFETLEPPIIRESAEAREFVASLRNRVTGSADAAP